MKKVFIVFMVFIYSILLGINIYLLETPKIKEINISDQINEDLTKNVVVKIKNIFNKNVKCKINDSNWMKPINNECSFNLESGNYKVYLKINKNLTISKKFSVEVNKILGLNVKNEKIYLAIDENYKLSYEIEKIGNVDEVIKYIIDDENILKIENDTIIPLNVGSTNITLVTSNDLKKTINVIVTDLFRKANLSNNYVKLSCYRYTMDEAHILEVRS